MYRKYVAMHLKSSFEYRLNTFMVAFSQIFVSIGELMSIYLLFSRFETVGHWGFYDAMFVFGIITTVFALTSCFGRGYDEFASLIKHGDFDRMLVRPVSIHKQILGSKIEFTKLGKTTMGIVVAIIALVNMNINWDIWKVLVLIATLICGIMVVCGLLMIGAGISVYTVENLEFVNVITDGSKELAYYPIDIYKKWLTRIFTFVIPIACFNYLPLCFLVEQGNIPMVICGLAPIFGMLFFVPCLIFFNLSLKRYQSSGT